MQSVGKSVRRVDAVAKVRGMADYVDDIFVKDMLQVKVFRSTIANGRVKKLDVSRARALPGVVVVVTYEDVPKHTFPTAGHPYNKDPKHQDVADRRLLTDRVRFFGDEIAAVVAVDELTAVKALRLIDVEYEQYEPILTAEAALIDGAVEIHEGTKNIIARSEYQLGDWEEALAQADEIFEDEFSTSTVQPCALENHGAYAYMDASGRVVVCTSTQIPHICRRVVGQALGIPWGRVRVIKPCVGGGFGSKQDVVVEPLVAFLTTVVGGRPVKLVLTREETFIASRVRHAIQFKLKTGVKKDGAIVARQMTAVSLNGGYASHGHAIVDNSGEKYRHLYDQLAIKFAATTVYTNMPAAGAMRGYGIPQVMFALDCHMEDIARALRLDPLDFRLKNLNKTGYTDPILGITVRSNGLPECIAKGRRLIRWDEKKAARRQQSGPKRRGLGMACFCYTAGTYPLNLEIAGARIVMNQDGSVQLQVGAVEMGQGSDTVFSQMAAETLGIPVDMVHLISEQDTEITPFDTGAYASRQTYISGMAVKKAAAEIKDKVLRHCGLMTGISPQSLDIADAWVVDHKGARVMPLAEVALDGYYNLACAAPFTADVTNSATTNPLSYGCTFAEVEVDLATGKVKVLEIYNVHDSGKIINPQLAEGQVHGGVSMGLGYALYEQMIFDPATGEPLNNNLLDYKLMTAADTPEIGPAFVETDEPTAPYGNKSMGEPPVMSPAPAVRNAILDATGVKFNQLPMNPHRLFERFKAEGLI
ncbi:xanthine dehydrogenase subunit XdhA [Pelotomaculum propionicicum]|uniref:Putative xanthine dehydrogenase molybdenum-binding subunit XdhA n=1 Tax=Pelotomaculum propionicicum TaxID=258475 RepID=A0A4Y7RSE7_9FIRM|nr:xanthine dehydrogenase subunit XdhA [Pelotomaculum propionicicum]TEB11686.1 putative xanthine dehydrogenase molybdenum-binding subunit XdhA [Pelotomaculum propionicicum]